MPYVDSVRDALVYLDQSITLGVRSLSRIKLDDSDNLDDILSDLTRAQQSIRARLGVEVDGQLDLFD